MREGAKGRGETGSALDCSDVYGLDLVDYCSIFERESDGELPVLGAEASSRDLAPLLTSCRPWERAAVSFG